RRSFSLEGKMRLVAIEEAGSARLGVVENSNLVDLAAAAPSLPRDLVGLIALGPRGLEQAADAVQRAPASARKPLDKARLLAPVPRPGKIVCLGLNYADHAAEGGNAKPEYPSFFMRGATSLAGHGEALLRPLCSEKFDYEAELVAVVGRRARHVKKAD